MFTPKFINNPQIVPQLFKGKEIKCISVEIEGEEYDICDNASYGPNFWGNSKPGKYGEGLGKTENDEFKPARTGILGQMAFAKIFHEQCDCLYRRGGDKQDNLIEGLKFDIKCSMRNRGENLVYHANECGKLIPLDKDIYVCSYIEFENRQDKKATVIITGYAMKKDVKNCEIKTGYKGNGHLNYILYTHDLRPICELLESKKNLLLEELVNTKRL